MLYTLEVPGHNPIFYTKPKTIMHCLLSPKITISPVLPPGAVTPLSLIRLRVPRNSSANPADTLQLPIAELDTTKANHPWINAQNLSNVILDSGRGIITHNEVVAIGVARLVLARAPGEQHHAPVGEGADRAARVEDQRAGGAGNPKVGGIGASIGVDGRKKERVMRRGVERRTLLHTPSPRRGCLAAPEASVNCLLACLLVCLGLWGGRDSQPR
jgi:hypothetical protein